MLNINEYQKKIDDYYFDYSYSNDLMALQKDLNDYAESKGFEVKILIGDHYFDNRGISKDSWEIWIFFNEAEKTLYGNSFSELFIESKKAIHSYISSK
tara:strand:- start:194 stop:487 length:294 start_codon:yes stop_codon:yes gene_type:complete